jgi:hypothetical protein
VGVFTAAEMEDLTRRKNGQWKCKWETWHELRQDCDCKTPTEAVQMREFTDEERLKNLKALDALKKDFRKQYG